MNSARNAGWPVHTNPNATALPSRPGVKKIFAVIDRCPICQCLHMTVEDFTRCKQQRTHREQD